MKYIIDHFEEHFAVCENESGELIDIEIEKIPKKAQEGDVLILKNGKFVLDKKQTEKLRKEIEHLMDELWED